MKYEIDSPIFFKRNRVYRLYSGGKLFGDFFGDEAVDGQYPEEWVASAVKSIKPNRPPNEGMSIVEGTDIALAELLETRGEEILGGAEDFGVLVKVLDSAIRLPSQVHPDKPFSKKYFGSGYGKTESWLVLGVRENPKLYFGFKEKMTPEEFLERVDAAEEKPEEFEKRMNAITPKVGDVFLIRPKIVHAIGAGCLILEVQEPTDFTIISESWCLGRKIDDTTRFLGLDKKAAMECFDFDTFGSDAVKKCAMTPRTLLEKNGVKIERLIGYDDTPCFAVNRFRLTGASAVLPSAPAIYIATDGSGELSWGSKSRKFAKGDYFLLPHKLKGRISVSGNIEFAECLPPRSE